MKPLLLYGFTLLLLSASPALAITQLSVNYEPELRYKSEINPQGNFNLTYGSGETNGEITAGLISRQFVVGTIAGLPMAGLGGMAGIAVASVFPCSGWGCLGQVGAGALMGAATGFSLGNAMGIRSVSRRRGVEAPLGSAFFPSLFASIGTLYLVESQTPVHKTHSKVVLVAAVITIPTFTAILGYNSTYKNRVAQASLINHDQNQSTLGLPAVVTEQNAFAPHRSVYQLRLINIEF